MLTRDRLLELLAKARGLRIGVVGDFCLDRYGTAELGGQSRETGDRIVRIKDHFFSPGGAANISWNVAELGAHCTALALLGEDAYGVTLRDVLRHKHVDTESIVFDPARQTPSFEKIRVSDGAASREARWDVVNRRPVSAAAEGRFVRAIESAAERLDCLIVADYDEAGSGVLTPPVVECLNRIAVMARVRVMATSRLRIGAFHPVIAVVNEYEAAQAAGMRDIGVFDAVPPARLDAAGVELSRRNSRAAFVTLGKDGMAIYAPDGKRTDAPTVAATGEIDICGAGDTALASIAAALSAGARPVEAALLGNVAASVSIRKIGITGAASPDEVLLSHERLERAAGAAAGA